jgi:hypothetical protein
MTNFLPCLQAPSCVTIGAKKQAPEPARWALPSKSQIPCNDRTSDACLPAIGTDPPSNQKYILLWRSFMLHVIRSMRL